VAASINGSAFYQTRLSKLKLSAVASATCCDIYITDVSVSHK